MSKLSKERLYYSISEVGEILNINQSTIRYWEKQFPILRPKKKTRTSKRKFNNSDIHTIYYIKHLLKEKELSINSAKQVLENWRPDLTFEELCTAIARSNSRKIDIPVEEIINTISEIKSILNKIQ